MIKIVIALVSGILVGAFFGYSAATQIVFRRTLADINSHRHRTDSDQYYATTLSLAALIQLETGHAERAKEQLAKQPVSYRTTWHNYDASLPPGQQLTGLIDTTNQRSQVLRDQLAKSL